MISPAIGTQVEFHPNGHSQYTAAQLGYNTPNEQQQYAIVAGVVTNDTTVNITFSDSYGLPRGLRNVPLVAVGGTPPVRPYFYAQMI